MLWSMDPASPVALHQQIAIAVRRAVAGGELVPGQRLPPAAELGATLGVNPNTVLHAYRRLREDGVLEFRRGRSVRVRHDAADRGAVVAAARMLLALGHDHGYTPASLAALIEELA